MIDCQPLGLALVRGFLVRNAVKDCLALCRLGGCKVRGQVRDLDVVIRLGVQHALVMVGLRALDGRHHLACRLLAGGQDHRYGRADGGCEIHHRRLGNAGAFVDALRQTVDDVHADLGKHRGWRCDSKRLLGDADDPQRHVCHSLHERLVELSNAFNQTQQQFFAKFQRLCADLARRATKDLNQPLNRF